MATMSTDALMTKLFKWTTKVEYEGVTFYLRIVGDSVLDDARREALLESRKLRRELRNTDGDDYLIYLDPLEDLDDSDLRDVIVSTAMRDVMRDYLNNTPRPVLPTLGDNPSQEEQENLEAEKEDRERVYIENMTAYVDQWRVGFEKTLESKDRAGLMVMAKKLRTDTACEQKFTDVFEEAVVCSSVYSDEKYTKRMFTPEQYAQLPFDLKSQLRNAYNTITIDPELLKN